MKIVATQKFRDALQYALEQKKHHLSQMASLVYKLHNAIPEEAQTEDIDHAFDALCQEFNAFEPHPYNSFQDCIMRILSFELNSQSQDEENYYVIGSEYGEHCLSFGGSIVQMDVPDSVVELFFMGSLKLVTNRMEAFSLMLPMVGQLTHKHLRYVQKEIPFPN